MLSVRNPGAHPRAVDEQGAGEGRCPWTRHLMPQDQNEAPPDFGERTKGSDVRIHTLILLSPKCSCVCEFCNVMFKSRRWGRTLPVCF